MTRTGTQHRENTEPGVRPAMQARSRATRQRILKILEKAVLDGNVERLTVADIARKAKSSVGAFYGRFADKAAALDALYADRVEKLTETLLEINREGRHHRDVHRWIGELTRASHDHALANQTLLARLAHRTSGLAQLPPILNEDTANTLAVLKIKPPHFAPPAAAFLLKMIMGLSRDAALFQPEVQAGDAGQQEFVQDLQKAALWYLTAPSA